MFHVYVPNHNYTPKQMKYHDNKNIFSLCCGWDSTLFDAINVEGDNINVSLTEDDEDTKFVVVTLENCNNNSFKNWIKQAQSYDSAETLNNTYIMYFKVSDDQHDKFEEIWNKLHPPPPSENRWCLLL